MIKNIFQSRKYSGLCVLSILLVSVTILLLTNDTIDLFPYLSLPYLRRSSLSDIPTFTPIFRPKNDSSTPPESPVNHTRAHDHPIEQSLELDWRKDDKEWNVSFIVDWKRCESPDYIPCLDNTKAIKKLKSKRNMEHRERHCPKPSPKCLVPLPQRYKIPLPWPQSRDMVRDSFLFFRFGMIMLLTRSLYNTRKTRTGFVNPDLSLSSLEEELNSKTVLFTISTSYKRRYLFLSGARKLEWF